MLRAKEWQYEKEFHPDWSGLACAGFILCLLGSKGAHTSGITGMGPCSLANMSTQPPFETAALRPPQGQWLSRHSLLTLSSSLTQFN